MTSVKNIQIGQVDMIISLSRYHAVVKLWYRQKSEMSKSKQESSVTSSIGQGNVEHTREKTILTNVVEIGASSIVFSSPVRVQLAALSYKSDTLVALSQQRYRWLHKYVLEKEKNQRERLGRNALACERGGYTSSSKFSNNIYNTIHQYK